MLSFFDKFLSLKLRESTFDAIEVIDQLISSNLIPDESFLKYLGDDSHFYSEFPTDLAYFISLAPTLTSPLAINEALEGQRGNAVIQVVLNSIIHGGVDIKDTVTAVEGEELSSRFVKTLVALCSVNPFNEAVMGSALIQGKLLPRLRVLWYLSFFETVSKHAVRSLFYSYAAYYSGLSQDALAKYLKGMKCAATSPAIELSPFCTWLLEAERNYGLCASVTELALDSFSSLYELHEGIPVLLKVLATCILELDQSVEAQREAGQNLLRAHSLLPTTIDAKLLTDLYTRNLGVTLHLIAEHTVIKDAIHQSALTYIDGGEYGRGMETVRRLDLDLQLELCTILSIQAPKLYYPPSLYTAIEKHLQEHSTTDWLPLFRLYTHNNDYKSAALIAYSNRCRGSLEGRKEALVMTGSSLELCEHKWINYKGGVVELGDVRDEMIRCRASMILGDQYIEEETVLMEGLIVRGAIWEAYELVQRSAKGSVDARALIDFLQDSLGKHDFGWLPQFIDSFDSVNGMPSLLSVGNERLAVLRLIELVKGMTE